jgi:hypothetical protein
MARIKLKYVNAFANRRRKNKRVRYYFRRRGFKAIPLPGLPGSEEFMTAYQMALAAIPGQERPEIGASRTEPGTINALVISYYRYAEWTIWRTRHGARAVASSRNSVPSTVASACGY